MSFRTDRLLAREFTEFLSDVETLHRTLKEVEKALTPPEGGRAELGLDSEFLQATLKESQITLNACEYLIDHNRHFKRSNGYVVNIVWAITVAEHVRQQQDRLQICFHKANFVLSRKGEAEIMRNQELMMESMQAQHAELRELIQNLGPRREDSQAIQHLASVDLVSDAISQRFANSGSTELIEVQMTISQRLDAVQLFYQQSTQSFVAEPPLGMRPSPTQYLNLLKTIWLMDSIKNDPRLQRYRQDPFNAAWAHVLDWRIKVQALRFLNRQNTLERIGDEQLLRQNESEFVVNPWQPDKTNDLGPMDAGAGEVLLMAKPLKARDPTRVEELRVFRLSKDRLRLARATSKPNQAQQVNTTVYAVGIDHRRICLHPIYALALASPPSVTWKASTSDHTIQELAFDTVNDARAFQELVTNFDIRYDSPALKGARMKCRSLDGQGRVVAGAGRIQIWKPQPRLTDTETMSTGTSAASGHTRSSTGSVTNTGISTGTWTEATLKSANKYSTVRSGQSGAFIEEPVPAQIVILTEVDEKMRTVSIRIDEHARVNPDKCRCSKKNSDCTEVYIESSKKRLKARTFSVSSLTGGWNVAVFSRTEHEELKHVEVEDIKSLSIDLQDVGAREEFTRRLQIVCNHVKNQVDAYNKDLRLTKKTTLYNT